MGYRVPVLNLRKQWRTTVSIYRLVSMHNGSNPNTSAQTRSAEPPEATQDKEDFEHCVLQRDAVQRDFEHRK